MPVRLSVCLPGVATSHKILFLSISTSSLSCVFVLCSISVVAMLPLVWYYFKMCFTLFLFHVNLQYFSSLYQELLVNFNENCFIEHHYRFFKLHLN